MKQYKTFLGTAATMRLGLGCTPSWVKIYNLATGLAPVTWCRGFLANSAVAGGVIDVAGTYTPQTAAQGLQRYFGGDVITTKSNNDVIDPALVSTLKVNYASTVSGDGYTTLFTTDTAATMTGHFDAALKSGAGAGSFIELAYKDSSGNMASWVGRIAAMTSTGLSAGYVTIEPVGPSITAATPFNPAGGARVVYVGPQYDLMAAPVGTIMPAGVKLINVTYMTPAVQLLIEWEDEVS
jgi:hypothetical protein